MPNWNLKTDEGLREACEEASQRIPDERVAEVAEFLREIEETAPADRTDPEFQRKLWIDNPIRHIQKLTRDQGFEDPAFHTEFLERISGVPPEEDDGRTEVLWNEFWETVNDPRVAGESEKWRPRQRVLRALASLFPSDFAGETDGRRTLDLRIAMGGPPNYDGSLPQTERNIRRHFFNSRWIQQRLTTVLGDPKGHEDHARRLLLSQEFVSSDTSKEARIWAVRAGKRGEDEETAAKEGIAILGFTNIADLSDCTHRDAVREQVRQSTPEASEGRLRTTFGQLARFRLEMQPEDLVVLPRKAEDKAIVLGRIEGPYEYREINGERRHTRRVEWFDDPVPRDAFSNRFGDLRTVWKLNQRDADEVHRRFFPPDPIPDEIVATVRDAAAERGLRFEAKLIERLHLGVWANEKRHFAVLAGLSGSGKTQLAMEYARALTGATSESDARLCAVSAAPGWHDPTSLLGYVNPLNGTYVRTEFLQFLLRAAEHPTEVHCCVLDEMNLSHPEQYLAPVLSAMEREGGMVEFHDGDEEQLGVPQRIEYPANLVLLGTVNMDETTMGLSDKVLDRAFVLEFWDIRVDDWPGWKTTSLSDGRKKQVRDLLNRLMVALRPARLHFGWRVIDEFVRLMELHEKNATALSSEEALDQVTYAKVLPKLRGDDSARYRSALEACEEAVKKAGLTESARKVRELFEDLEATGSFLFWR